MNVYLRLDELELLWSEQEKSEWPVVDPRRLVELKKTNREKDFVVIGELARLVPNLRDQLLASRSARDILDLADKHPELIGNDILQQRPALRAISSGRAALEASLDQERRELMRANEARLRCYSEVAKVWLANWPKLMVEIEGVPLSAAHTTVAKQALKLLPMEVAEHEN